MHRRILGAILALGLIATFCAPARAANSGLSVLYTTQSTAPISSQAVPWFQIVNAGTSPINLSQVTVRYWLTNAQGLAQQFNCDWAQVGCGNLSGRFVPLAQPLPSANEYLEIGFGPDAPALAPGQNSGDIQTRFNDVGWVDFSQANDYSFDPAASNFTPAPNVTLYVNGQLVWGIEPSGAAAPSASATPSPVPTAEPTSSPRPTPTPRPTATPAPTPSPTPPPAPTAVVGPSITPAPTPTAGAGVLEVEYLNMNTAALTSQANPWFEIVNRSGSPVALSSLTVRYWFTSDTPGVSQQFNCDWAQVGASNVSGEFVPLSQPLDDANRYLQISFSAAAGVLAPGAGSGEIQTRFNDTGWITFNQANDYSFDPAATAFTAEPRITLYQNGVLVWGTEPNGTTAPPPSATPGATITPTPTAVPTLAPTPIPSAGSTPVGGLFPAHLFAPYVDVTLWPTFQLTANASAASKYYTLAFIVDGGNCTAQWGAVIPLSNTFLDSDIASLRAGGGDVIVSFGGEANQELAETCTSLAALESQYEAVVDRFNLKRIDFDIEGAAIAQPASIALRNQALAQLQAAHPSLQITYTLPVMPTGLTQDGVNLVSDALAKGVKLTAVNVMAMDYGQPDSQMGQDAINAANATAAQLATLYPGSSASQMLSMVGVTPMIGYNDVQGEVFQLSDAQLLLSFAQESGLNLLSFWSANRDQPCPAGQAGTTQNTCSGVAEQPFGFSAILHRYNQ